MSPRGTMTRYVLALPRPLSLQYSQLCAEALRFLPPGIPRDPDDHYGCYQYVESPDPVGEVTIEIREDNRGVVARGWVLDPLSENPVQLRVTRGAVAANASADRDEPRSASKWPQFATRHGFEVQVPFAGTGGSHELCIEVPGRTLPNLTSTLGCAPYKEYPRLVVEKPRIFPQGQDLNYRMDMLDPHATGAINILAAPDFVVPYGFYLVPWRASDLPRFTADANGHAEGTIASDMIPPGQYTLMYGCSTGCSALGSTLTGTLADGTSVRVGQGGSMIVQPSTAAAVTVTETGQPTLIDVAGSGFPSNTDLEVLVSPKISLAEGIPKIASEIVTTDASGAFSRRIQVLERADRNLVYVISDERFLASAVFKGTP